jgi:hypothetical protein
LGAITWGGAVANDQPGADVSLVTSIGSDARGFAGCGPRGPMQARSDGARWLPGPCECPGLLAPSNLTSTQINMDQLRDLIDNLLYPELRSYGRKDRVRLLQEASKEPLDFLEWVGMLAALVLVVSFTRYSIAGLGLVDRLAIAIANFFVAVPLLVVTVGPLLVRRNKRGLQKRSQ